MSEFSPQRAPEWRGGVARAAMTVAVCAAALSLIVIAIGGFVVAAGDLRLSVRSLPAPLSVLVLALAAAWVVSPVEAGRLEAFEWAARPERSGNVFATLIAAAVLATGLGAGTWVAGSADASGYVAEATLLASGRLTRDEPLARTLDLPSAPSLVSPLGFRPARDAAASGRLVPTYPPGLPVLMAVAMRVAGPFGTFLIVPVAGACAVWLMFAIARSYRHPGAGLAAAALLATHPSFLYQLVQPMSDVPVTAAWLLAALAALQHRATLCGVATGVALLIRPNLLPMALPIALCLAASGLGPTDRRSDRLRTWGLGVAPFLVVVAALHTVWFGAPWRSGYGDAEALFRAQYIGPNFLRYARWLVDVSGGPVLLMVAAAVMPPRHASGTRLASSFLVLAAFVNVVAYLPYFVFDDWHYLRFLLPAVALLLVLGLIAASRLVLRLRPLPLVLVTLIVGVVCAQAAWQLRTAATHDAFRLRSLERRYPVTAAWLRAHSSPTAVVLTSQQSGNVALNASRSILRWDLVPPGLLDRAVTKVRAAGRDVWLIVEAWEQPAFIARHGQSSAYGVLAWPPAALVSTAVPVRVYNLADLDRFRATGSVDTEYVFDQSR